MKTYQELTNYLTRHGFIFNGRDDFESADGGLPTLEKRQKSRTTGEMIQYHLIDLGFTPTDTKDGAGMVMGAAISGTGDAGGSQQPLRSADRWKRR